MNCTGLENSGMRQQAVQRALGRVVDVVEVGDPGPSTCSTCSMLSLWSLNVWSKSLSLLTVRSASSCFRAEPLDVTRRLVQRRRASGPGGGAVREHLRYRRHVAGELDDLLVTVGQCVDQHLQVLDCAEEIAARIPQAPSGLRQLPQRIVERLAVAVERVGGLVDRTCAERALARRRPAGRAGRPAASAPLDLVPLDRNRGAGQTRCLPPSAADAPPV